MSAILNVSGLHVHYGVIEALKGIDIRLERGEITAILGANGAGKSTALLAISGLVKSTSGSIRFEGIELSRLAPHEIVAHGVVHVPEGREILTTLTVRENLLLGSYRQKRKDQIADDLEKILAMFPRLSERLGGAAGNLSGGEQQMLTIARALMARPRLLLLDEPSMGMAPIVVLEIFNTLRALNRDGLTILLVEQNARLALSIAHRGYVMENGGVALSGSSQELISDPKIIEAYLGA